MTPKKSQRLPGNFKKNDLNRILGIYGWTGLKENGEESRWCFQTLPDPKITHSFLEKKYSRGLIFFWWYDTVELNYLEMKKKGGVDMKNNVNKLTPKDLSDAKGGIPYEKPVLNSLGISFPKGDCDDGGFNIGYDAECTSGNKNIDLGPPKVLNRIT